MEEAYIVGEDLDQGQDQSSLVLISEHESSDQKQPKPCAEPAAVSESQDKHTDSIRPAAELQHEIVSDKNGDAENSKGNDTSDRLEELCKNLPDEENK